MKKIIVLFIAVVAVSTWVVATAQKETSKATATTEHKIVTPADVQWGDAPPGLPPGAKMAVLDGDPNKAGSFTVRLKTPANYKIPPHTHPTAERVTGISGMARIGMGEKLDETAAREIGPGTFALLPPNMAHFAIMAEETVVQIQSEGPFQINYVNPADDPRNAKKVEGRK
jgi:quercetin dioxygenase-like cupin family protein